MFNKYLVLILASVFLVAGCDLFCPPDPVPIDCDADPSLEANSKECALAVMDQFFEDVRRNIGSADVLVPPAYRPVDIGGVYIEDLCNLSIQSKAVQVFDKIDESQHTINTYNWTLNTSYSFDWKREWERKSEGTFGLMLLDHALEAAFSNKKTEVSSVKVKLSLEDPYFEEFSSPQLVEDALVDALVRDKERVDGDVLVVGVWRATVRTELELKNSKGNNVELTLGAEIADLINFDGFTFATDSNENSELIILKESSGNATAFAVLIRNLEDLVVDDSDVQKERNSCNDAQAPSVKIVKAYEQSTNPFPKQIATFTFRELNDNSPFDRWAVDVKSALGEPVSFGYDIFIEDVYGQLVGLKSFGVINLQPGETEAQPTVTQANLPDFNKSDITVRISNVR